MLSGQDPLDPLDHLNVFLVQAVVIISICRALAVMGHYLKQPKVIFEIIGGILLGPSAIGRDAKYLERIFPLESLNSLKLVAEIGLVLYLFLVGMELDIDKLATHAKKAGGVAIFGMAVPFALGIAISSTIFKFLEANDPTYADVSPTSFFVFIGVSSSINDTSLTIFLTTYLRQSLSLRCPCPSRPSQSLRVSSRKEVSSTPRSEP